MNTHKVNIFRCLGRLSKGLAAVAMALALAGLEGCTDKLPFDSAMYGSNTIYFAVDATATRGVAPSRRVAGGVTAMTSPSGEHLYLVASAQEGIDLSPRAASTRGVAVASADQLGSIGVYARFGSTDAEFYMENEEVQQNGDSWATEKEYLWPGADRQLHFNAYAPFCGAPGAEGITSLPSVDANGEMTLAYTVPADVASQQDLMWADPTAASASPCELQFNHALTAIRFVTGDEMSPCTVREVSFSGVKSSGVLSLESGQWKEMDHETVFSVSPDKVLEKSGSTSYAEPREAITSEEQTFLLLPQKLDNVEVSVTVEIDGKESTFTSSLSGQEWRAGTTLTYRLSVNPVRPSLFLQVEDADGNVVESISSRYSGGEHSFIIRSVYDPGDGSDVQDVDWTASFVDASGAPLAKAPEWIIDFPKSGSGRTACKMVTDLPDPVFLAMNEHTARLRAAADANVSSGHNPYNLSSATGAATVENTANCYMVSAPGHYSLPLVYGNAVKNGATNEAAYKVQTHSRTALKTFLNHLGNPITDPYIYNNSGCTPVDASLIWEGRLNLVRNVKLSADKKWVEFDVPASSIRQGNALVGVSDADGKMLWSWHIWVTDIKLEDQWQEIPTGTDDASYYLLGVNLGFLYGGDETLFGPSQVTVRFSQKNVPAGLEPLTADVVVSQESATVYTPDCHSFYQWGRKDPLISNITWYYDAAHNVLPTDVLPTLTFTTDNNQKIAESICFPDKVLTIAEDALKKLSPSYLNLWNIAGGADGQANHIKSIYDPCPVGAKVPVGEVFSRLYSLSLKEYHTPPIYPIYDEATRSAFLTLDNGTKLRFPLLGYRSHGGAFVWHQDGLQVTTLWAGHGVSGAKAQYYGLFSSDDKEVFDAEPINSGYGVRPIRDD